MDTHTPPFALEKIQQAIVEFGFDGWLLYDFRGLNVLALRVLGIDEHAPKSRRFFYYIPAEGSPQKLVHRIETDSLDHLPGQQHVYLQWQQLHNHLQTILANQKSIAMEYSPNNANPYVSRVDAGTVELVRSMGPEVASSGNLIQYFESRWTDQQWQLHLEADKINRAAFEMAWALVAEKTRAGESIREMDVQNAVMSYYADHNMTTYHAPIVAVGRNSGNPHYAPLPGRDAEICKGDFLLLDMWAKLDVPMSVYSDLTKVGFVGDVVPEEITRVFDVVAASRDAGIACVKKAFAHRRPLQGWEVDQATRDVIENAGMGDFFIHRTGHNIGQETHGNGAHMDNLETKEDRLVMPQTCFSIEPGVYQDAFGIRSEINVFIDSDHEVHVTGGIQTEVLAILA
jgi:Xaa-Pro aminopeptidase